MRREIKRLLLIGLTGALLTAVGDFLLAYGENQEFTGITGVLMANALNLKDWQLIVGALLGMVGIFLEGIGFFAVYKLIKKEIIDMPVYTVWQSWPISGWPRSDAI